MNLPIWRFDDVSINTDIANLQGLISVIRQYRPTTTVLLAISPITFSTKQFEKFRPGQQQRVHPNELTAMSDIKEYYKGASCGTLQIPNDSFIVRAGHGIAHVDHRLLGRKSQEMSILMSCALAQATVFVPPYNKYNATTEGICWENSIELVKWEDGWKHILYNPYHLNQQRYYMHPYDATQEQLMKWFTI
jgi:hypothetical protein